MQAAKVVIGCAKVLHFYKNFRLRKQKRGTGTQVGMSGVIDIAVPVGMEGAEDPFVIGQECLELGEGNIHTALEGPC